MTAETWPRTWKSSEDLLPGNVLPTHRRVNRGQGGCSYGLQAVAQIRATWATNTVLDSLQTCHTIVRTSRWSRPVSKLKPPATCMVTRSHTPVFNLLSRVFLNGLGQLRHISQERGPLEWPGWTAGAPKKIHIDECRYRRPVSARHS